MDIILIQDVEGLGKQGDKTQVAPGYARNFLFPMKLALEATSTGARQFAELDRQRIAQVNRARRDAQKLADRLKSISLQIAVQVGEDDKLFGSVTSADIAQALADEGIEIDRRTIQLEEPLKVLGVYTVKVKLHPEVDSKVKVLVRPQTGA
ncbi:MAG: 50S ribosomal protein L9 [Candidatus Eisenbacteria bacterium]|uniref:Large ribosomal subunit protein bL9 n=1 Tax=Eiseniibacteriota bacterium TaxID=2212470 RepID=A0A948RTX2_UNCEI|nr:50S ribosomal protein L9 [Candidatus Eisenbacteria bacterium]MBU1950662.1 50S ribosomal protein L9 [Candidatus Eisenbacteria bacterium]MBU2689639.1 50S ribosomal protein L9 [Candidatus Eisenbacteria bacterium]